MKDAEREHLRQLAPHLGEQVIGQLNVVPQVCEALLDEELGLTDLSRPKGTFLFLGPTGVGKTQLCLSFTDYLFGEGNLIRLDMSEFQNQDSVGVLLGRSEDEIGMLAKRVDSVGGRGTLLLDEIEKAHPRVLDLLLQILDAARITMANGETLDLSQFYIVCTSNIAGRAVLDARHSVRATLVRFVESQAQAQLRPEIFARFQCVCVFERLEYESQLKIAQLMLDRELRQQEYRTKIEIGYPPELVTQLAGDGFHPRLGARSMRSCIERHVRAALRTNLLGARAPRIHLQPKKL
ncbi:MAG: ATP-dependent Clp protease ATP-binding subunit ClpA [Verrucomicrobiales bacterium]|jgi:ATP-dependent Clp protease ATP-binding subunit ClpA